MILLFLSYTYIFAAILQNIYIQYIYILYMCIYVHDSQYFGKFPFYDTWKRQLKKNSVRYYRINLWILLWPELTFPLEKRLASLSRCSILNEISDHVSPEKMMLYLFAVSYGFPKYPRTYKILIANSSVLSSFLAVAVDVICVSTCAICPKKGWKTIMLKQKRKSPAQFQ